MTVAKVRSILQGLDDDTEVVVSLTAVGEDAGYRDVEGISVKRWGPNKMIAVIHPGYTQYTPEL